MSRRRLPCAIWCGEPHSIYISAGVRTGVVPAAVCATVGVNTLLAAVTVGCPISLLYAAAAVCATVWVNTLLAAVTVGCPISLLYADAAPCTGVVAMARTVGTVRLSTVTGRGSGIGTDNCVPRYTACCTVFPYSMCFRDTVVLPCARVFVWDFSGSGGKCATACGDGSKAGLRFSFSNNNGR